MLLASGAIFLWESRFTLEKYQSIPIHCPKCGKKVAEYDGRATINIIAHCLKCQKRIVFHPDTFVTEAKKIPPRQCSSGCEFR